MQSQNFSNWQAGERGRPRIRVLHPRTEGTSAQLASGWITIVTRKKWLHAPR